MKRFLIRLYAFFRPTSAVVDFQYPNPVAASESLTRFVFSSSQVSKQKGVVKPSAFEPWPTTKNTSVFRIQSLVDKEVWALSADFVEPKRNKLTVARGDLHASSVLEQGLTIQPTLEPHPRHANIENWPTDEIEIKQKTVELSKAAKLVLRP